MKNQKNPLLTEHGLKVALDSIQLPSRRTWNHPISLSGYQITPSTDTRLKGSQNTIRRQEAAFKKSNLDWNIIQVLL